MSAVEGVLIIAGIFGLWYFSQYLHTKKESDSVDSKVRLTEAETRLEIVKFKREELATPRLAHSGLERVEEADFKVLEEKREA